ncbi:MAG: sulfatase-like hydrolase/transferase, partial [Planctomycetes bacterium]|nr:sulfatase-like hydrolase/transferase [Planctomycetota bacterium]
MSRRALGLRLLLPVAVLAAAAGLWHASRRSPPRYNLVLISIDSLVRDRLGLYGHRPQFAPKLAVSPRLDALARESVVFDDAQANSSWTLPVHMSLMTGLGDGGHQVVDDGHLLDPLRRTLAQQFRDAGAATAGFYSGPYLDPRFGFGRGFDRYQSAMMSPEELQREMDQWLEKQRQAGLTVDEPLLRAIRDRVSHYDVTSPRLTSLALEFLDQQPAEQPFFLFLHYFDAHFDYLPERLEAGLGKRFDPGYQGDVDGLNWMFNPAVREVDADGKTRARLIGERDLDHVRALYDAEIHWVDR